MKIQVVVKLRTGPGRVEPYALRRLRLAVAGFAGHILRARMWITDGRPGTIDVDCRVEIVVKGVGEINVTTVAKSPYTAVDLAMRQVRQSLERRVQLLSE